MTKLIECVPNFSTSSSKILSEIINAITSVSNIILLDQEFDSAHNRSVVTFVGNPESVVEAAFRAVKKAQELIDMNKHRGEHPRIGATDVIPLIPLSDITEEECIELSYRLGKKIGDELEIPVYLYEKSAKSPERVNLATIREGEYEGLKKEITVNSNRYPDFGPRKLGSAGATAIGVRELLIAYNINLKSTDLSIAKKIARKIRFRDGGFPNVKALGFDLKDKGMVQVSMNLTNYKVTPPHVVFNSVKKLAKQMGVADLNSEIVGLIPQQALINAACHYLHLDDFSVQQILEVKLGEKEHIVSLDGFLDDLASSKAVPGGGSASALIGAIASALLSMVAQLTIKSKKYANVHKDAKKILQSALISMEELKELMTLDAKAYENVIKAGKLLRENKLEVQQNEQNLEKAYVEAAEVPLKIAEKAKELLDLCEKLVNIGNKNAISDVGVSSSAIQTAIKGALLNVQTNLKGIKDATIKERLQKNISLLEQDVDERVLAVMRKVKVETVEKVASTSLRNKF